MPLMPGNGVRVPEERGSWLLQPGSGCPAWRKEGGQDTVGLKRQPKSMSGIAGNDYHEIHLSIGSESVLNLIIFIMLCVGIKWSKSVNNVKQAVGVAQCFSFFANW